MQYSHTFVKLSIGYDRKTDSATKSTQLRLSIVFGPVLDRGACRKYMPWICDYMATTMCTQYITQATASLVRRCYHNSPHHIESSVQNGWSSTNLIVSTQHHWPAYTIDIERKHNCATWHAIRACLWVCVCWLVRCDTSAPLDHSVRTLFRCESGITHARTHKHGAIVCDRCDWCAHSGRRLRATCRPNHPSASGNDLISLVGHKRMPPAAFTMSCTCPYWTYTLLRSKEAFWSAILMRHVVSALCVCVCVRVSGIRLRVQSVRISSR